MNEIQQKIDVEMEQPMEAKPEKKARKKRISVPKKEEKLKLSKFDFILLQLLKEGKTDSDELRKSFNVDAAEFRDRLVQLKDAGYLNFNEAQNQIGLSMRGVNDYSLKWKTAADEWLGRKEKKPREAKKDEIKSAPDNYGPLALTNTIQAKLPIEVLYKELELRHAKILELPEEKRAEETVDIMELMKKYGPTEAQKDLLAKKSPFVERHMKTKGAQASEKNEPARTTESVSKSMPVPQPVQQEKPYYNRAISDLTRQAAELEAAGEKCELCKSGFIISVRQEEHNPKYGHCFCGAPYHKDCYESIATGDGKCIKCGRKLGSGSDFKIEEAFKAIKDITY